MTLEEKRILAEKIVQIYESDSNKGWEEDLDPRIEWNKEDLKNLIEGRIKNLRENPGSLLTHEEFIEQLKVEGILKNEFYFG